MAGSSPAMTGWGAREQVKLGHDAVPDVERVQPIAARPGKVCNSQNDTL